MHGDLKTVCRNCHVCQLSKTQHPKPRHGNLIPMTYNGPMDVVSIDAIGPLNPVTKNGNRYIFVLMDNFSNYIWLVAAEALSATITAQILLNVFLVFGFPKHLLSDRGSNFLSEIVRELLKLYLVKHKRTSAWHPQTDGKNERSHSSILSLIRAYIPRTGLLAWDKYLLEFGFALNNAPLAGSGQTPAHLFFARVPRSAQDESQIGQTYPNVLPDSIEAATSEVREMQKRAELARNFLVEYRKREHVQWKNRRAKVVTVDKFNAGDKVIVYCPSSQKGISTKLINQYRGPYEVVGLHKLSDGTEAQNV